MRTIFKSRAEQSRAEQSRAEQSRAEQSRAEQIDVFRAFGIILMVMGHIGFGSYFDHFIHAFHMPMFFFVSGLFFRVSKETKTKPFIIRKVRTLLLPYIVFGIFHYAIWFVVHLPDLSLWPLKHVLFNNTDGMPYAGAIWFLTAMFFSELIYFCIRKYFQRAVIQHIIVIVISLFGCISTYILPFRLPWALDAAFVGVGLLHLGWLAKKYESKIKFLFELSYVKCFLLAIVTVVLVFLNGYINMRQGEYAILPMFWINACLCIMIGINISTYCVKLLPNRLKSILTSIGRNSIVFLCLNQIVILAVGTLLDIVTHIEVIQKFAILAVSMIILYGLMKLFMNTKLRVVLGKH